MCTKCVAEGDSTPADRAVHDPRSTMERQLCASTEVVFEQLAWRRVSNNLQLDDGPIGGRKDGAGAWSPIEQAFVDGDVSPRSEGID